MRFRAFLALLVLLAALTYAPVGAAMGSSSVAALQVVLFNRGIYRGTIDGVKGPMTTAAIRRFQQRPGLMADGIVGRMTLRALGRYARYHLGERMIVDGMWGWDVAALQFRLAWHGFPSGPMDARFGTRTGAALFLFQRWRGIGADGVAGPVSVRALRGPLPRSRLSFAWPIRAGSGTASAPAATASIPASTSPPPGTRRCVLPGAAAWSPPVGRRAATGVSSSSTTGTG